MEASEDQLGATATAEPDPAPPTLTDGDQGGVPDPPEAPAAAGEPAEEPDLREQVAALERRIGGGEQAESLTPDQVTQALAPPEPGDEEELTAEEWAQLGYGDPQGQTEMPEWAQQIATNQESLTAYLQDAAERQNTAELNQFVKDNPDLQNREIHNEVVARATEIAERAGVEHLRRDPQVLSDVLAGVRARKAAANEVTAEEARTKGAPIETDAAAAAGGDGEDSYEEARRAAIRKAGPEPNALI